MKLEDLATGQSLAGIEPSGVLVSVVAAVPIAEGTVRVVYQTADGVLKDRLLGRADEAAILLPTTQRPWSFDGDPAAFQLACEAKRIDLAFLFDPMMAVHTSNVQPLPHQITAVYESMLPRQPLRFLLADDPGAGKTIMAGDFDHDTQFCLSWFQQFGWTEGKFGEADVLARSKGTSVDGCKQAGVIDSGSGIVRLLKPTEYPSDWEPKTDRRLPVWEALHQMIRAFRSGGESEAGRILAAVSGKDEAIRQLAYRLYTLCERSGRADDARAYNELVTSWVPIEAASMTIVEANAPRQTNLFDAN